MHNSPRSLLLVVLLVFLPGLLSFGPLLPARAGAPAASQAVDFAALDAYIQAQMAKHGFPGVALAVVQGDEIIYQKGYGTAGAQPMSPQTQMYIGSQSKSFTALLIAQLAERGKLDLNAPVQRYIPWFKIADPEASGKITTNHFLHHTSGLAESGFGVVLPPDASSEEAVRALASAQLVAPVGTRHMYFNLGYDVLTYLIETITGQRYADMVRTNIFDPLGMTLSTADPTTVTNLSQGYTRLFGFAVPMAQPVRTYEIGAGYIVSTAEDLARYALVLQNGGEFNGTSVISASTVRKVFTPGLGDYGLGWFVSRDGQKIWHGGANETFSTDVNLYPKKDLAYVLLVNQGYLVDHYVSTVQLTNGVEALVLGKTPPPVSQGWSVRWLGWGLGLFVLALCALHTWNFYHLFNGWAGRFSRLSRLKKILDVSLSFLIPTIILAVIFSQMQAFFGYRFNLVTTLAQFRFSLPDIFILMLAGTLPDYAQGLLKLAWIGMGKTKTAKPQISPTGSYFLPK